VWCISHSPLYHISSSDGSSQTSSFPGAIRNRQPGGSARYGTTFGHNSARWPTCTGSKKPGSSDSCSPAQMNQPVVSPSGGWRRPLIGQRLPKTLRATPAFRSGDAATGSTPKRRQSSCCAGVAIPLLKSPRSPSGSANTNLDLPPDSRSRWDTLAGRHQARALLLYQYPPCCTTA